jgi:acyl-coenzyme A synthetase/AMP-(fatty) acid ligase
MMRCPHSFYFKDPDATAAVLQALRELPRTAVGKIQKHVLKKNYALGTLGDTK